MSDKKKNNDRADDDDDLAEEQAKENENAKNEICQGELVEGISSLELKEKSHEETQLPQHQEPDQSFITPKQSFRNFQPEQPQPQRKKHHQREQPQHKSDDLPRKEKNVATKMSSKNIKPSTLQSCRCCSTRHPRHKAAVLSALNKGIGISNETKQPRVRQLDIAAITQAVINALAAAHPSTLRLLRLQPIRKEIPVKTYCIPPFTKFFNEVKQARWKFASTLITRNFNKFFSSQLFAIRTLSIENVNRTIIIFRKASDQQKCLNPFLVAHMIHCIAKLCKAVQIEIKNVFVMMESKIIMRTKRKQ